MLNSRSAVVEDALRLLAEREAESDLAAAYGCGIARNHPFIDGNKRTAAVVMETFLVLNGGVLTADRKSVV